MNRRNFLQLATLAVAAKVVERVWPLRVCSVPKKTAVLTSHVARKAELEVAASPAGERYDQMLLTPVLFKIPIQYTRLATL